MDEVRWLTHDEQRAWRAFLFASLLVDDHIDRQLRRDSHMSHDYYGMLARLSEAPDHMLRMSDLAERTASSPSRLTHAVTHLEKLGWVERRPCPTDRRVQYAALTPVGFNALAESSPGHVAAVRRYLFDALSEDQVHQLSEVMGTVVRHINPDVAERAGLGEPAVAES